MADTRMDDIKRWTQAIIDGVAQNIGVMLANKPAQLYNVTRMAPNGAAVPQRIELPQAMCELTDQLRVENGMRQIEMDMRRAEIETMVKLREELERGRKVGEATLKEIKRQGRKDREEDDE